MSVNALGNASTGRDPVYGLRRRGTHVQIGLTIEDEIGEIRLPTDLIVHNELTRVESKGIPPARYHEMFRKIVARTLDPGTVITEAVSPAETSEPLASMTDDDT